LPGRELHPLKAPGLSWRTEDISKVRLGQKPPQTQRQFWLNTSNVLSNFG
jgi:hypothetical protein